ncbi:hypothetical protein GMD78_07720 [Ornithinibacillus sp. L9]|uniref:Uncharacterized protein n=1 Tax=Ornithinibacillus caprae TaxID=2678566 RepID=A0A6N8FHV2_9BACI|nr:hypothetical protein [Ornithinibacillus caprae]MUK88276.1 hypothetical protein [Ornithinibacillus caprae]
MNYSQYWNEIYEKSRDLNSTLISYWQQYSFIDSWQFWFVLSLFIIPLVILYFALDRTRIFEILFFGYTVHILWTYVDTVLGSTTLFVHKYFLIPLLPFALSLSSALLPVGFLLIYQYCTNNNKNFYLFTILISAIFAFGFASLERYMGLVEFNNGMNQFYVFLIDIIIAVVAFWLTKFFLKLRDNKHKNK